MFGFGGGKDPGQGGQSAVSLLRRGPALRVISSGGGAEQPNEPQLDDRMLAELVEAVRAAVVGHGSRPLPRGEAARQASEIVNRHLTQYGVKLAPLDLRTVDARHNG